MVDAPGIRFFNRIANAWSDTPLSWLTGADIGAMAAHLLTTPSLTNERTVTAAAVSGSPIRRSHPNSRAPSAGPSPTRNSRQNNDARR
jgi:hypothetical protein